MDDSSTHEAIVAMVEVVDVDLEKLEHCGRKEKGWYVCTVHVSGEEWRSVRSVELHLFVHINVLQRSLSICLYVLYLF